MDLARLWRDQSHITDAHGLLALVHASFTEGFDLPDLIEAKALLDELDAALPTKPVPALTSEAPDLIQDAVPAPGWER